MKLRAETGFSLVEMMVVVAIIGLLAGTVMLSYPGMESSLRDTAQRTGSSMQALSRHATLSGQVLGVRFGETGFTVHALADDGWIPAPDILRSSATGFDGARLQSLRVDGRAVPLATDGGGVHIWFLPTGDRPDFSLTLSEGSQSVTMSVTFSGKSVVVTDV